MRPLEPDGYNRSQKAEPEQLILHLVVGEPIAIAYAKLRGATVLEVLRNVHTVIGHSRLSAFHGDV